MQVAPPNYVSIFWVNILGPLCLLQCFLSLGEEEGDLKGCSYMTYLSLVIVCCKCGVEFWKWIDNLNCEFWFVWQTFVLLLIEITLRGTMVRSDVCNSSLLISRISVDSLIWMCILLTVHNWLVAMFSCWCLQWVRKNVYSGNFGQTLVYNDVQSFPPVHPPPLLCLYHHIATFIVLIHISKNDFEDSYQSFWS